MITFTFCRRLNYTQLKAGNNEYDILINNIHLYAPLPLRVSTFVLLCSETFNRLVHLSYIQPLLTVQYTLNIQDTHP